MPTLFTISLWNNALARPDISHRSSATSHQSPVINHQLPRTRSSKVDMLKITPKGDENTCNRLIYAMTQRCFHKARQKCLLM